MICMVKGSCKVGALWAWAYSDDHSPLVFCNVAGRAGDDTFAHVLVACLSGSSGSHLWDMVATV